MSQFYVLRHLTPILKPLYLIDQPAKNDRREYVVEEQDGTVHRIDAGEDDGSPAIFVLGGSEVTLDELHYIAEAQHEKNAERERKGIVPGSHRFKDEKFWQEGLIETREQMRRMAKGQTTFGSGSTTPSVQRSMYR